MNIFEEYLNKIINITLEQNKKGILMIPENLNSINVDVPPKHFDCDISTNVAMVLAKINSNQPENLAKQFCEFVLLGNEVTLP